MHKLRVLTYNIEFGRRERLHDLYTVLAQCAPDVATLNEADDESVVADLAQLLGMHYVWAKGSGDRHIGTLSRFPILEWQVYTRKPLTQAALVTTLDFRPFGQAPLTIYNVHFRPDPFWHFELFRFLAANKLVGLIGQQQPGPHLIMGDLNTYAPGDPVEVEMILRYMAEKDKQMLARQRYRFLRLAWRRLRWSGYSDCFRHLHPNDPGYTFTRQQQPVNRMDYILADQMMVWALRRCEVVREGEKTAVASDHFPLLAEFAITPQ